jgi:hypothetical protein
VSPVKAKSVWFCLGILASVATVQERKKKEKKKKTGVL